MKQWKLKFYIWLAARMPKVLVYFCANQLGASVTTHEYSNREVGSIGFMDMLGIYSKRYNNFSK